MLADVVDRAQEKRIRVYVHLYRSIDAEAYRRRYAEGIEPEETPYGFHRAADEGCTVAFSSDGPGIVWRAVSYFSRKWLKFDVPHAFYNRHKMRDADVVWTIEEGEWLAISFLKTFKLAPSRPIIGNVVKLLNGWEKTPQWKRAIYRKLIDSVETITAHSNRSVAAFHEYLPDVQCSLLYFGVNTDIFKLTPPQIPDVQNGPIQIFAPGNDLTRDWGTLLQAFGNDARFTLTIICAWLTDEELTKYNNVSVVRKPRMEDFLTCYHAADFVAVPMKENVYSGITVALEAAALGRPVLSSRTGGVPTYFEEGEVWYTPVGDPVAMRELVLSASADERRRRAGAAQERFVKNEYSTRAMVKRNVVVTRQMLAARSRPAVSIDRAGERAGHLT